MVLSLFGRLATLPTSVGLRPLTRASAHPRTRDTQKAQPTLFGSMPPPSPRHFYELPATRCDKYIISCQKTPKGVLNAKRIHPPHGGCIEEAVLTQILNSSVGEPVFRVSDEGGFRRARPPRPRGAEARVSGRKPTEVGRVARRPNSDKTIVHQGVCGGRGYPRCGDRCGDTLKRFNSAGLQPPK
jgi:hypothetical protein